MADVEGQAVEAEEEDQQVRSAAVPKDAAKLPVFKGDKAESVNIDAFLRSLRRYFRIHSRFYRDDENDEVKLATIAGCFPLHSLARIWFDNVEESLESYEAFVQSLREHFAAGEENLIKLQSVWEQARQGKFSARDFYHFLLKLRMRIAAVEADAQPTQREFLVKYCVNLSEPARSVIAKKRTTDPDLTLPQLVKLAEPEDKSSPSTPSAAAVAAALRSLNVNSKQTTMSKYCFYCGPKKGRGHTPEECRGIAARKAAGTWEERPVPPRKERACRL